MTHHSPPFSVDEAPKVIATAMMLNFFNRYMQGFYFGAPMAAPFS